MSLLQRCFLPQRPHCYHQTLLLDVSKDALAVQLAGAAEGPHSAVQHSQNCASHVLWWGAILLGKGGRLGGVAEALVGSSAICILLELASRAKECLLDKTQSCKLQARRECPDPPVVLSVSHSLIDLGQGKEVVLLRISALDE